MSLPTDVWSIIDEYTDMATKRNLRLTSHLVKLTVKIKSINLQQKLAEGFDVKMVFPYVENLKTNWFNLRWLDNLELETLTIYLRYCMHYLEMQLRIKANDIIIFDYEDDMELTFLINPLTHVGRSLYWSSPFPLDGYYLKLNSLKIDRTREWHNPPRPSGCTVGKFECIVHDKHSLTLNRL